VERLILGELKLFLLKKIVFTKLVNKRAGQKFIGPKNKLTLVC